MSYHIMFPSLQHAMFTERILLGSNIPNYGYLLLLYCSFLYPCKAMLLIEREVRLKLILQLYLYNLVLEHSPFFLRVRLLGECSET